MQFAADENFNGTLLGQLRHRLPDLDVIRVQDTPMYQSADPDLLAWAARENRILLTHDYRTIPGFAFMRVREELPMPGVILVREVVSMGILLDELELLIVAGKPEDFENTVKYIPLS